MKKQIISITNYKHLYSRRSGLIHHSCESMNPTEWHSTKDYRLGERPQTQSGEKSMHSQNYNKVERRCWYCSEKKKKAEAMVHLHHNSQSTEGRKWGQRLSRVGDVGSMCCFHTFWLAPWLCFCLSASIFEYVWYHFKWRIIVENHKVEITKVPKKKTIIANKRACI